MCQIYYQMWCQKKSQLEDVLLGLCQEWPPNVKARIRQICSPRHGRSCKPPVFPCKCRAFSAKITCLARDHNIGSLQAWQSKRRGERTFYVQLFILHSLSWGGGRKEEGRDQDSLVSGYPKSTVKGSHLHPLPSQHKVN